MDEWIRTLVIFIFIHTYVNCIIYLYFRCAGKSFNLADLIKESDKNIKESLQKDSFKKKNNFYSFKKHTMYILRKKLLNCMILIEINFV